MSESLHTFQLLRPTHCFSKLSIIPRHVMMMMACASFCLAFQLHLCQLARSFNLNGLVNLVNC
eukprot:scaffold131553_cov41-Attheya_sp.AAC.2